MKFRIAGRHRNQPCDGAVLEEQELPSYRPDECGSCWTVEVEDLEHFLRIVRQVGGVEVDQYDNNDDPELTFDN